MQDTSRTTARHTLNILATWKESNHSSYQSSHHIPNVGKLLEEFDKVKNKIINRPGGYGINEAHYIKYMNSQAYV